MRLVAADDRRLLFRREHYPTVGILLTLAGLGIFAGLGTGILHVENDDTAFVVRYVMAPCLILFGGLFIYAEEITLDRESREVARTRSFLRVSWSGRLPFSRIDAVGWAKKQTSSGGSSGSSHTYYPVTLRGRGFVLKLAEEQAASDARELTKLIGEFASLSQLHEEG